MVHWNGKTGLRFEYGGHKYEFFYSPSRDLYEALVPANTMTAQEVVNAIVWENSMPTTIKYGKISNILGCYETDSSTVTYFIRRECDIRDTSGLVNAEDHKVHMALINGLYTIETGDMDVNLAGLAILTADVGLSGCFNNIFQTISIISGSIKYYTIETIDNFS